LSIPSPDADDATLLQYALQLRETQPALFAGAKGVLVLKILEKLQAKDTKLQRGDIVVSYNGQPINTLKQFTYMVQANVAKSKIELQVIRNNILQKVVLKQGKIKTWFVDITEEMAKKIRSSILDHINEEGIKAYNSNNYLSALQKWQRGVKKAHEFGNKAYLSQFLSNIGIVYEKIGQYQQALDYYQQALETKYELGDKVGIG
jgi:tetratricopeptide (TPR) repeat protein